MDSSFFLTTVAVAAIGLFTLLRKVRFHQDNQENGSSSSSSSSPSSSLSPLSLPLPSSSSSRIWTHHVFPSFRGEDVRRDFLSHIQMEFERKGITPFIDNEIKRGESIGPELIRAIRESKIAVVLLSRNYASSKWCLDELVEIMKCREEFGQTVLAIFYKVDLYDIKQLTGDFGKVFRKTCVGKTHEDIGRWRQALSVVATIAGYHSNNWDNEAAMIMKIATDISNKLNNSITSSDFDGLVGMRTHLVKMKPLLCLESDEVRMIGILGPPGIGKTTIARVAYNQLSNNFQLSTFVDNIKAGYTSPRSDEYNTKLKFHKKFISQITNHKDMEVSHLGVVQDRLKDKKILVVFDGVDKSIQLDAMANETSWFGPGSRIIITSQDHKLLRAHGVRHIYKVNLPEYDEARKIFCMYAFGQEYHKDGFKRLVMEVTRLAGKLPLGLRVLGSYFKGVPKQEWKMSLSMLKASLDANIHSILKFSYDALDDEDKDLFLHIACLFNFYKIETVEDYLSDKFLEVRQRLNVLAEKSLISLDNGIVDMEPLLQKLGTEIVRKQSIHEPGQRQFLIDEKEIREVLSGDVEASKNIIGITLDHNREGFDISERAFEVMSNLQFLVLWYSRQMKLPRGLNYLPHKLRVMRWIHLPVTCLPSTVSFVFLVELDLRFSELEKLWEGIKPLPNLKYMDLSYSSNLKKLPDLSTATNLLDLNLRECISLVELPESIGYAESLQKLKLGNCSELIKLPFSIENATKLKELYLDGCKKLLELPSFIWNAINLKILDLSELPTLLKLPSSIENLTSLEILNLSYNSNLRELPSSIGNLISLKKLYITSSNLMELPSSIGNLTSLEDLYLEFCSSLREIPSSIGNLISLKELSLIYGSNLRELPSSIGNLISLKELSLKYCSNLRKLPPSIGNLHKLENLNLHGCDNLSFLPATINMKSLSGTPFNYIMRPKPTPTLEFSSSEEHQLKNRKFLPIPIWIQILDLEKAGIKREYIWNQTVYISWQEMMR